MTQVGAKSPPSWIADAVSTEEIEIIALTKNQVNGTLIIPIMSLGSFALIAQVFPSAQKIFINAMAISKKANTTYTIFEISIQRLCKTGRSQKISPNTQSGVKSQLANIRSGARSANSRLMNPFMKFSGAVFDPDAGAAGVAGVPSAVGASAAHTSPPTFSTL